MFLFMVFTPDLYIWARILGGLMFLVIFSMGIFMVYTSFTNIKPKKIILEEDRIIIPRMSAPSTTFYYAKITELELSTHIGMDFSVLSSWLSNKVIYVADKRHRCAFICRAWMKNKKEFRELFEMLKEKVACYQADDNNNEK